MISIQTVDLRSDTVTQPSPEMREAMARALVGDDVYGEDPTVNRLEEEAAALVGKEAALFVASGTMGNQLAILSHTGRGDEVIADSQSHIYYYEAGAPALWSGVSVKTVDGLIGHRAAEMLLQALRPENIHFPTTRLVCLENTFNRGGGTVIGPEIMERVYAASRERLLKVHLDGARIFNAAAALKKDARDFANHCDSVMFCLSKGLGAPVGSILAGDFDFIASARRYRKALGGGMRQAGILAAAGLVALRNTGRLDEDHRNARLLAEGLDGLPGIDVELGLVQTNMVMVRVTGRRTADELISLLEQRGVKCGSMGPDLIRLVTHLNVSTEDIAYTLSAARDVLS